MHIKTHITGIKNKYHYCHHSNLKETSFGGDHQDIRVAFILHSQQFICWRTVGPKLKWCASTPDLPFVGHITKLVEFTIIIGHIISWMRTKYSQCSRARKQNIIYWKLSVIWKLQYGLTLKDHCSVDYCSFHIVLRKRWPQECVIVSCCAPANLLYIKNAFIKNVLTTSVKDNSNAEWSKHFPKLRISKIKII